MSLHRILNNDGQGSPSVRGLSVTQLASPQPVIDPALAELSHLQPNGVSRRAQGASTRRSSRNQPTYSPPAISPLAQIPGQQPLSFRQYPPDTANSSPYERHPPPVSAGPREPYNGTEWNHQPEPQIQPAIPTNQQPYFPNGNGHPQPPVLRVNDDDSDGTPEINGRSRKRKAVDDDDADYNPRSARRVRHNQILPLIFFCSRLCILQNGLRRNPPRGSRSQHRSASVIDDDSLPEDNPLTEEDLRLQSSDLEDCKEIWMAELGDYILETRKRHREVEAFYKLTVIVGCSSTRAHNATNPTYRKEILMLLMHWRIATILSSGVCHLRFHHHLPPRLLFMRFTSLAIPSTPPSTMTLARRMIHMMISALKQHRSSRMPLLRPPTELKPRSGPQSMSCPTPAAS